MTQKRYKRQKTSSGPDALFGYLIPFVIIGLSIADFAQDGRIDKYLIGSLVLFGLAALGYRVDTLLERYVDRNGHEKVERKPATKDAEQ